MSGPACFTCREKPAGNTYAGAYSAYCLECQPRENLRLTGNSQFQCAQCKAVFGGLRYFDAHQSIAYDAVSRIICKAPEALGLILDVSGTWRTPESVRSNAEKAARMRTVRERRAA